MGEAPKTGQDPMDTFTPRTGSETNPFTADLKGDFASSFGTNTNAVSQIFKEGGFGSGGKKKMIAIALGVIVLLGIAVYAASEMGLFGGGDESGETEDEATTEDGEEQASAEGEDADSVDEGGEVAKDGDADSEAGDEGHADQEMPAVKATNTTKAATHKPVSAAASQHMSSKSQAVPATGDFSIVSPKNGASHVYDESATAPEFRWEGGAGTIVFSRSSTMNPEVFHAQSRDGVYRASNLYPGKWYWQIQGEGGGSQVQSFVVDAPVRRNIAMVEPKSGASISGQGGMVSWKGDHKITHFRVELSSGGWAHPNYRFSTAGLSMAITGVTAGSYQMRLGAFSEVSGRWEYTAPIPVNVQ